MTVRILTGDCRTMLATLPDASVQMVCTSPPYYGLRNYGTATWEGGDQACEHTGSDRYYTEKTAAVSSVGAFSEPGDANAERLRKGRWRESGACTKCGAVHRDLQIGLEQTPDAYVAEMVAVFREVRRVLADSGVVFLNLGDSYCSTDKWGGGGNIGKQTVADDGSVPSWHVRNRKQAMDGIKPKDLLGIPWAVAFALRADGWWLRSAITWCKTAPMPESVVDRPTSATEMVFLLAKSGSPTHWLHRDGPGTHTEPEPDYRWIDRDNDDTETAIEPPGWRDTPSAKHPQQRWRRINLWRGRDYFYDAQAIAEPSEMKPQNRFTQREDHPKGDAGRQAHTTPPNWTGGESATRNARNWWVINPQPYSGAHFACVDAETECLTAEGWRRHGDMRVGMMAAQFDMASQKLSWAPVERVATYEVANQDMVVGKCRDLDMWLTPNHRTVIQRRHPRSRAIQPPVMIRADELLASHSVPTAAKWDWQGDASLSLEWAELLGWYVTEGCESKGSLAIELYQSDSANPHKCRRIEELLRQVGAEWTKATCDRTWKVGVVRKDPGPTRLTAYRVTGYAAVRLRELAPGKKLPWAAVMWSQERIAAVLQGLIEGDGHTRLDGRRCFIQKDKDQCDLVQALAIRLGFSATVAMRADGVGVVYITKHVTRSFRGTNGAGSKPEVRPYTGVVWCPKLPHGTWVARRNGRPFITGNTMPPDLAERCIKAGTSERGQCPHCAAPWARVVERGPERDGIVRGLHPSDFRSVGQPQRHANGGLGTRTSETTGWSPTCACPEHAPVPQTVLDPFGGAGTTGLVADRLGRNAVLIELNPDYAKLARNRVTADAPLFAEVAD